MKKLWIWCGKVGFWLSLPFLAVYLSHTKRTRVVVRVGDEVLVQKAWLGDGNWILPGGGVHGKEDTAVGAVRELYEECGIVVQPEQLTFYYRARLPFRLGLSINTDVYGIVLDSKPKMKLQKIELIELRWVSIESLNEDRYLGPILKQIDSLGILK